ARRTVSVSTSRVSGRNAPTASTWVPGRRSAPPKRGVGDVVAHVTMSAPLTAERGSWLGSAATPSSAAIDSANRRARVASRPSTTTRSSAKTAARHLSCWRACTLVPKHATRRLSGRARCRAARAEGAPARGEERLEVGAPEDQHRGPRSAPRPPDHPLDRRLQHELGPLVLDTVAVGDDAPVELLRLTLIGHLDLDRERVSLEHRRDHADLAAEERHAGAVDEAGLHDQALGERPGQGSRRRAAREDRLARDVLHVHEERLGEPAEVDEGDDVGLRHRAAERAEGGTDLVRLEGQALCSHGPSYSPR